MAKLLDSKQISAIRKYMKDKAKSLAPRHIAPHIGAVVTSRVDGWSIRWIVNSAPRPGPTPDAAAREYGSGIHGVTGRKYIIAPKNPNGVLAFNWEKADRKALAANIARRIGDAGRAGLAPPIARRDGSKFYGFSSTDRRLLFNWVEHPGVEAANNGRGYLRYAMDLSMGEISNMVLKGMKDGIAKEIYKNFRFRNRT